MNKCAAESRQLLGSAAVRLSGLCEVWLLSRSLGGLALSHGLASLVLVRALDLASTQRNLRLNRTQMKGMNDERTRVGRKKFCFDSISLDSTNALYSRNNTIQFPNANQITETMVLPSQ